MTYLDYMAELEILEKAKELVESILDDSNFTYTAELQESEDKDKNSTCVFVVEPNQAGFITWTKDKKELAYVFHNTKAYKLAVEEGWTEEEIAEKIPTWVILDDLNSFIWTLTHPVTNL